MLTKSQKKRLQELERHGYRQLEKPPPEVWIRPEEVICGMNYKYSTQYVVVTPHGRVRRRKTIWHTEMVR